MFRVDALNNPISIFIGLFSALILIYSLSYMYGKKHKEQYYFYFLLTIATSFAAVLADNLIIIAVAWGFLGFTLYMLINLSENPEAISVAKKSFMIIGATDSLMVLGIGIIYHLTGSLSLDKISQSPIALDTPLAVIAFLCFAAAAFAKAGAIPFHSWIPDCAQVAYIPVTALLPASLDKLLGIYLLVRVWQDVFIASQAMMLFLMIIGAITIIAAVMMALIQHDFKKLLGYHAVSQVGYMVLGIGTANPLGIAGGIFHMFNHSIYKTCLFLGAGAVEEKTQTSDLDKLGGLYRFMPVTFICCLIASLSISGIPPFNGFVSKWMVYQGIIERMSLVDASLGIRLVMLLCLAAAMFGSALTLASFIKFLHATFLGQSRLDAKRIKIKEVSFLMWLPMVVLALLCIIFGIFAYFVPIGQFIQPIFADPLEFLGVWQPVVTTWLILFGLGIGIIIYLIANIPKSLRTDSSYIGGENLADNESVSGADFYLTLKQPRFLNIIYELAEAKMFDIYEQAIRLTLVITKKLKELHTGFLHTYLIWAVFGIIFVIIYLRK